MASLLLVDDEPSLMRIYPRAIAEWGWTVRAVQRAAEALDLLQAEPVDLLVTDVNLRDGSGCALALEAVRRWSGTRLLLITGGQSSVALLDDCAGMALLVKPFSLARFKSKIAEVMSRPPWQVRG